MAVLLQMIVCLVTVIQMTSCQSINDPPLPNPADIYSRLRDPEDIHDIVRPAEERKINRIPKIRISCCWRTLGVVNRLMSAVSQLQRDVDELKTDRRQKDAKSIS